MGADWLWPMLPLKASSSGWSQCMCPISLRRETLLFSMVSAVPWWSEVASFNGWLECNPWSQDKVGQGARRDGRCESSLIDLMVWHNLVDRFHLDHPEKEILTWLDSLPSAQVESYLDRVLVRRADCDFVCCPTFHLIGLAYHKHVWASLQLANRPSLPGYWKFNTSLLEIPDFRDWLESLIKQVLVGVVTKNRWWASLKHRIKDFASKYSWQLNLGRTRKVKSIEDRLSLVEEVGYSLNIEIARMNLEHETSKHYKGFIVRSRLKRVLNEAVTSNATACEEEVQRFPGRYIDSIKSLDGRLLRSNCEMCDAFRAHFRDPFPCCPDLLLQEFCSYLADFPCKGGVTECRVCDPLQGLEGLPYEVYLRLLRMFVPILTDMFNHWFTQGAIPVNITKGVISLLKKGGRHVWEGLDDYRSITLLNTELKILARVLVNWLALSRLMLWREDWSKTTCTWFMRS